MCGMRRKVLRYRATADPKVASGPATHAANSILTCYCRLPARTRVPTIGLTESRMGQIHSCGRFPCVCACFRPYSGGQPAPRRTEVGPGERVGKLWRTGSGRLNHLGRTPGTNGPIPARRSSAPDTRGDFLVCEPRTGSAQSRLGRQVSCPHAEVLGCAYGDFVTVNSSKFVCN